MKSGRMYPINRKTRTYYQQPISVDDLVQAAAKDPFRCMFGDLAPGRSALDAKIRQEQALFTLRMTGPMLETSQPRELDPKEVGDPTALNINND